MLDNYIKNNYVAKLINELGEIRALRVGNFSFSPVASPQLEHVHHYIYAPSTVLSTDKWRLPLELENI